MLPSFASVVLFWRSQPDLILGAKQLFNKRDIPASGKLTCDQAFIFFLKGEGKKYREGGYDRRLAENLRIAHRSSSVFSKVLAARMTKLITAHARKNKSTARMLANARKDHSIP